MENGGWYSATGGPGKQSRYMRIVNLNSAHRRGLVAGTVKLES